MGLSKSVDSFLQEDSDQLGISAHLKQVQYVSTYEAISVVVYVCMSAIDTDKTHRCSQLR
jgi:hypothetical protein